ncbi:uncharacterized protein LOC119071257 [Bradysia coprophila]|uniref:uncharacterized protein LOC119071257 n=1 Tax=Bradysia coprophila TaxID=38358 RepID=UPI00187D841E|nr:uncharacterized protein LOC119071257 [Bradysia coprophila]
MPIYCFVPECKTIGTKGFHRFPADSELRETWMEKTNTLHLNPTKNHKICHKHFKETDLITDWNGKEQLAPNAIPSLFLPQSSALYSDHDYYSIGPIPSTTRKRLNRLKNSAQGAIVSDDNVGNEVEVVVGREETSKDLGLFGKTGAEDTIDLGPYINADYILSLEEQLRRKSEFLMRII